MRTADRRRPGGRGGSGRAALRAPLRRPHASAGPTAGDGWRVVAGDFVEADEGTGVVHLAPAFGEVDRQAGRDNGLPTLNPVGPDGRFTADVPWLSGQACGTPTARSTTGWRRPASCSAATRTPTPTRTAGGAAPRSSTGASPAGTCGPPTARPTWWRRTRPSAGIPSTSATAGWGSGWPTTWTGPCHVTGTGGRRCPSGGAPRATSVAWGRWPSCLSWPDATSPASTPTGRLSTRSPSPARLRAGPCGGHRVRAVRTECGGWSR